ncbi:MAG: helix-turn-helix domain-containing protein [Candidatus Omnitrophica bacterium]|nr:helix-turn-helix domain-containing protein [Candidatus Omnitrophota bacterium]
MPVDEDAVLTIKDVAKYLSLHTSTIYRYAQKGVIPAFKVGSDWRFSRRHIDAWIDSKISENEHRAGNGRGKPHNN